MLFFLAFSQYTCTQSLGIIMTLGNSWVYMQGLKDGRAYLWGFTVCVKKNNFFSDTPTALIRYTVLPRLAHNVSS